MQIVTRDNVLDIQSAPVAPHLQPPVLLPPGETELAYISNRLKCQFGRGVLEVWFAAVEYGNIAVPRYYNVQATGKKSFVAPRGGDLVADFRRIFTRRIQRLDRFPICWLEGTTVIGELGTVNKNSHQKPRDEGTEYSIVRKVIQCL